MKNLNLNEQEKQRGWHDFCNINHANQTEFQADTLSASGSSAVSVTLEECPAKNALITRLSRANHALFPLSRCVKTLIRIGDYVVGGRARRGAGKEVVAMMRQKCMMWKYAAMVVLMLTLGVGEMWADNAGINETDGANINMLVDGVERINMNCSNSGTSPYSATTIVCSSLILEKAYVRTWKNNSNGNICGAKIYYHIWRANAQGNYDNWETAWTDGTSLSSNKNLEGTSTQTKQEWWNDNINIDVTEGLPEGRYVFEYNFQVTGDNSGTGGCGATFYYNNSSSNYRIPFTLKRSCTVSSEVSTNVFLFDAVETFYTINSWKSGCCGTGAQNIYTGGESSTNLYDRIGNYFVYGIKNGTLVNDQYNTSYETFEIVNSGNTSEKTGEKSISDHKGNFYKYSGYVNETREYPCPVTISRTHYGPIWGDELNMTFKLKNWTNLEGGTYTISSPDGATITGASGSIAASQGTAKCIIKLPEGTSEGNVEIDFDYTVNSITFHVKTYIHVFEPIVLKVKDEVGFGGIYMKSTTKNGEDWNSWPGIQQEHLGGDWYLIRLNPHLNKFWLNNGSSAKQTYSTGMDISGFSTGQVRQLLAGTYGVSDCYLGTAGASGVALYRVKSFDGTNTYYSNAVELGATGEEAIMSFYADLNNASSTFTLQSMAADATSWSDGATISKATFTAVYDKASVTEPGNVFTAKLNSTTSPTGIADVAVYAGDYLLSSGATTSNYLTNGESNTGTTGTKFIYFEPNTTIFPNEPFRYYWVDWFPEGQTVIASVGNIYNDNLAKIIGEDLYAPAGVSVRTGEESKYHGGNVRFAYNPKTNYFSRTIIGGSGGLIKIKGTRVNPNSAGYDEEATFSDASAWVYTVNAVVKGKAKATITTAYNYVDTYLATNQQLIGGNEEDDATEFTVLITYDFKTNRLIAAWKPSSDITGFNLESNLMAVRRENGSPTVLNIQQSVLDADKITLSGITKIYTALEITYDNWSNGTNTDRRITSGNYTDEYYWISLPYKCYVGDIFGIDGYGSNGSWVIQTYHGDYRAQQGWWAETDSWWYDLDRTDTLQANQGYVVRFTNLKGENNASTGIPSRFPGGTGSSIFLYFPSYGNNLSIALAKSGGKVAESITSEVPKHKCDKVRDEANHAGDPNYDRRAIDSNWNIIGSPSFNSTKIATSGWGSTYPTSPNITGELKFFYTWNASSNPKYQVKAASGFSTFEFKATHAYLVQYGGTITWQKWNDSNPLVVLKAPARDNEEQGDRTLKMVLNKDGEQADVTYISRMAEGATEGYDLNLDLSKLLSNSGNNLYTLAGYYKMAGNCLPETTTTVPVGVQIAAEGEYTFSMPEGTNGTGAVLIDHIAGTRTNLALTDYTVQLPAGQTDNRFVLELSPISNVATGDLTPTLSQGEGEKAHKALIDGVLYIVKDGQVFDARGNKVK